MINRREAIKRAAWISGIAWGSPMMVAVLNGCQAEKVPNWEPKLLTLDQARLVGKIADRILPPTDTPGAVDVGVDQFIDLMLNDMFEEEDRLIFLQQLDDFTLKDANFNDKKVEEQDAVLQDLEQTYLAARSEDNNAPKSFFQTIKELTLLGYFTSKEVMENQLNYHAVPGKYEGCIPSDGRVYVDNNV